MKRGLVWVVFLVVALAGTTTAHAQDLVAALRTLAIKLDSVAELRGKYVGVAGFPTTGGRLSELSAFVADQFDEAIVGRAASGGFTVVSRAQVCQIAREYKLWLDDRFDAAASKKIGNLIAADYLLGGQLTPFGKTATVSASLVDTKTGRLVWKGSTSVAVDEGIKRLMESRAGGDQCGPETPPATTVADQSDASRLAVKVSTDQPTYRIGDSVRFRVQVNRDAYVTLVDVGTSGDVTILFPNRLHADNLVRAGQEVVIPPLDAGFTLTVQAPAGTDHIRAIATIDPVTFVPGDFGRQGGTFRSLDRVQTRNMTVEMTKELGKIAPEKRADHVIAVGIRP